MNKCIDYLKDLLPATTISLLAFVTGYYSKEGTVPVEVIQWILEHREEV